jgi:hypothetical protein
MWNKIQRIYIGTQQVRPKRHPWANTLLYMPLNWNTTNYWTLWWSWTWNWTASYTTLSSWIQVANPWSNAYILTPSLSDTSPLTLQCWMLWHWLVRNDSNNWTRNFKQLLCWWTTNGYPTWNYTNVAYFYNGSWYWTDIEKDITKWQLVTLVYWNNWIYWYVNWVNFYSDSSKTSFVAKTQWFYINYDAHSSRYWNWKYSDLIIERKQRTAQEISDYYNQTKANYWL